MSILNRSKRQSDDKINTIEELVITSEDKLWESDPMKALTFEGTERRKKLNWWTRTVLSIIIVLTFLFLVFGGLILASNFIVLESNFLFSVFKTFLGTSTLSKCSAK